MDTEREWIGPGHRDGGRPEHGHGRAAQGDRNGADPEPAGPIPPAPRGWAEALLDAEEPILAMIGGGRPLPEVLDALSRMIESLCAGATCSVLLLDPDGKNLRWAATPSLPPAYRDAVEAVPVGPGCGSCGTAAHLAEAVIVEDIAADPLWERWREGPLAVGLRACWSVPIRSSTGGVLGTFGTFLPVPRRPADHELRLCRRAAHLAAGAIERARSEGRYRRIVETANEGIWTLDARGHTTFTNPKMAEMLSYAVEEVLGRPVWDFVFEEDAPEGRRGWRRKVEGQSEAAEYRLRRKDGSPLWVHGSTSPVYDADGRFAGALGMFADITRRKRAEEALALQARVLESMAEGVSVSDEAGIIIYTNPAEDRIFGYEPGELVGRHVSEQNDYPPEENARIVAGVIEELRATGSWSGQWRNRRKDGTPFWTHAYITAIEQEGRRYWVCVQEDITERVRAEERLRESEERFRAAVDQAAIGVALVGPDHRTLFANRGLCEMLGYGPSEMLARSFVDVTHPDDLGLDFRQMPPLLAGEVESCRYEKRYIRKDGSVLWGDLSVSAVRDGRGGLKYVVGVLADITARKRAEEALRASEGLFRHLAAAMPQMVWITRPDRSVEYVNRRWLDYTGQTLDEALGPDGWRAPVHPDDLGRIIEASLRSHATGEPFEQEYRLRDRSGTYRWFLGRAVPVRDEAGRLVRRFGTATDINDRRRAEQAARFLAEASATLSGLVDEADTLERVARLAVPVFADWCAVDLAGEGGISRLAVAHTDPAKVRFARDLLRRYPIDPDASQGVAQVIRTGRSEIVAEISDEMLTGGAVDEEHLGILRDLGLRSYLCVPLAGRAGTIGAITFVLAESGRRYGPNDLRTAEDLAHRASIAVENARLYAELKEADRRKGEFLATLAHELRNPLAPVRNAARLLAAVPAVVAEAGAEVEMIERQVAHVARLVDDLMDVARIERGRFELRREVVELAPVVRHAVESIRPRAEGRGHELIVGVPAEPVRLEADPTRLEQVLDNLLSNAVKYTEPGGRITVEARRDGGRATIRVQDTGIGIPAEKLPHVFEMFAQVDHRSARAEGGLGIGLGLVRSLVEMHGGSIEATSEGPGTGSEFVVRLPILEADTVMPVGVERPGRGRDPADLPRRRILVVDDNADAANSLARVLTRLYRQDVQVAHDGAKALELAAEVRPDVVILDIGMPGMDGHEVARRLRQMPEAEGALLVALTGWGQEEDRRRSSEAGFDRHLVKPVDPEHLRGLLDEAGRGAGGRHSG